PPPRCPPTQVLAAVRSPRRRRWRRYSGAAHKETWARNRGTISPREVCRRMAMVTSLSEQVLALQQRLDDATRRAESLRRVIESISGELALQPLLTRIIQCAVELIGADDGAISLVVEKPNGAVMRTLAGYNMPQLELGHEIGPGVGLSGLVLQQR